MRFSLILCLLAIGCGRKPHLVQEATTNPCFSTPTPTGNLITCGDAKFEVTNGASGPQGAPGSAGPAGKDADQLDLVQTSVACGNSSGTNIKILRAGDVISDFTVCNGVSVNVVPSTNCDGISIQLGITSTDICNGADGSDGLSAYEIYLQTNPGKTEQEFLASLIGPTGAVGQNGADGQNGSNGQNGLSAYEIAVQNGFVGSASDWLDSLKGVDGIDAVSSGVTPVKLCSADNSAFPEYGLKIGNDIYAVYYGNINNSLRSFLAKLTPGTYVTTNGANCQFTIGQQTSIPAGATHELLLCGVVAYKVSGGVSLQGVIYGSNTNQVTINGSLVSCSLTNPGSSSISSSGGVGPSNTSSCNYNGIPSVNMSTPVYNTGASSSGCYVKKL